MDVNKVLNQFVQSERALINTMSPRSREAMEIKDAICIHIYATHGDFLWVTDYTNACTALSIMKYHGTCRTDMYQEFKVAAVLIFKNFCSEGTANLYRVILCLINYKAWIG